MSAIYVARLLPVGVITDVNYPRHGRFSERFDQWTFKPQTANPEAIPVMLDHEDRHGHVGNLRQPLVQGGWWTCAFTLDAAATLEPVARDRLRVGTPVSAGFLPEVRASTGLLEDLRHHLLAELLEVSVLHPEQGRPVYKEAKVIAVVPAPRTQRRTGRRDDGDGTVTRHVRHGVGEVLNVH